jgi:hypothetical protein
VEDTRMADVIDEEHKQRQVAATPLGRLLKLPISPLDKMTHMRYTFKRNTVHFVSPQSH